VNDHLAIFMLDVGQGDGTVVLLPNRNAVVFDCADDVVLDKLLRHWQVPAIEAFVLSHLDQDHIAGALQFLQTWTGPIGVVALSADRDLTDEHEEARRAKALVDQVKLESQEHDGRGRRWELITNERYHRPLAEGPGWSVRLLAPAHAQNLQREREGAWEDANRYSSILRVEAGGTAMLIGGDAPLISWSALPAAERPAHVFRIPHHGGALDDGVTPDDWNVARLYREVDAKTALVSVGTNNGHGHPREPWVGPITGGGACRMLCTQVTARCHAPFDAVDAEGRDRRDADEIAAQRKRVLQQPEFNHWAEPPWRHLTDRRGDVRRGRLEVPCAGDRRGLAVPGWAGAGGAAGRRRSREARGHLAAAALPARRNLRGRRRSVAGPPDRERLHPILQTMADLLPLGAPVARRGRRRQRARGLRLRAALRLEVSLDEARAGARGERSGAVRGAGAGRRARARQRRRRGRGGAGGQARGGGGGGEEGGGCAGHGGEAGGEEEEAEAGVGRHRGSRRAVIRRSGPPRPRSSPGRGRSTAIDGPGEERCKPTFVLDGETQEMPPWALCA